MAVGLHGTVTEADPIAESVQNNVCRTGVSGDGEGRES